jgi:flagellar biosynthesis component FlhA
VPSVDRARIERELERLELGVPRDALFLQRPLTVELSLAMAGDLGDLIDRVDGLRSRLRDTVGVRIPFVRFTSRGDLGADRYVVSQDDLPLTVGSVDLAGAWRDGLLEHLGAVLADHAAAFMDEQAAADLVKEGWSSSPIDAAKDLELLLPFAAVLRGLLEDGVPVVDVDMLLDAFRVARAAGASVDECLRRLRALDPVRRDLPGNRSGDARHELDADLEAPLVAALVATAEGRALVVPPDVVHEVLDAVRQAVAASAPVTGARAVVVHEPAVRRGVRLLLRPSFPDLHVIAAEEVSGSGIATGLPVTAL